MNFDHLEKEEFQKRVLNNYKLLCDMNIGGKVEWVDASIDEPELTVVISELIVQFVQEFCEKIL